MTDELHAKIDAQTTVVIAAAAFESQRHKQVYGKNCVCPLCRAVEELNELLKEQDEVS